MNRDSVNIYITVLKDVRMIFLKRIDLDCMNSDYTSIRDRY